MSALQQDTDLKNPVDTAFVHPRLEGLRQLRPAKNA